MGNLNSRYCPVCGVEDRPGSWTCPVCTEVVSVHKELLRNLRLWRALYEDGMASDVLRASDGQEHSLWDVQTFADARFRLAQRQAEAIEHCLLDNLTERESALKMGIGANDGGVRKKSPVAIYVTVGVSRLLGMVYRGEIYGYRLEVA